MLKDKKKHEFQKDFLVSSILPKNEQKEEKSTLIPQVELFLFIFWKNSGYQHVISKLTDLYQLFALENLVCHCTIVKSSKKEKGITCNQSAHKDEILLCGES